MSVSVDAVMTTGNGVGGAYAELATAGELITSSGMTVGSGATLLVVMILLGNTVAQTPVVTWDGVSMTVGPILLCITGVVQAAIFTLVNPHVGNKTLSASWSTGNATCYMSAISFKGTDTITGINSTDSTSGSNVASLTVTSSTDGATVATYINDTNTTGAPNFTAIFQATDLGGSPQFMVGYGNYKLGGTSNIHTFASATEDVAIVGVHVIASPASISTGPSTTQKAYGSDGVSVFGNIV